MSAVAPNADIPSLTARTCRCDDVMRERWRGPSKDGGPSATMVGLRVRHRTLATWSMRCAGEMSEIAEAMSRPLLGYCEGGRRMGGNA
jgi:hypothetical protein